MSLERNEMRTGGSTYTQDEKSKVTASWINSNPFFRPQTKESLLTGKARKVLRASTCHIFWSPSPIQ